MNEGHDVSAKVAAVGLASLAAAMGIGRFAFTPIFPLMQEKLSLTLAEGAWLATANYVGYLLGACASFLLTTRVGVSARGGLVAVALSTLAMAVTGSLWLWLLLRLVAGKASAFVLIGASAWALGHLSSHRRSALAVWVFVVVSTFFRSTAPRRTAALSLLVMAVGVAAPAVDMSLYTLAVSSVCVGGTFMVMTMAAVQEAKRISVGNPTKLIAALTAAFALGQLAG